MKGCGLHKQKELVVGKRGGGGRGGEGHSERETHSRRGWEQRICEDGISNVMHTERINVHLLHTEFYRSNRCIRGVIVENSIGRNFVDWVITQVGSVVALPT